jgi:hypothetical protein
MCPVPSSLQTQSVPAIVLQPRKLVSKDFTFRGWWATDSICLSRLRSDDRNQIYWGSHNDDTNWKSTSKRQLLWWERVPLGDSFTVTCLGCHPAFSNQIPGLRAQIKPMVTELESQNETVVLYLHLSEIGSGFCLQGTVMRWSLVTKSGQSGGWKTRFDYSLISCWPERGSLKAEGELGW